MIVVEGPDGSGKTELCRYIAEEFGFEYRRAPSLSSTTGPDEAAVEWFAEQLQGDTGDNGVYDRVFIISEPIYQLATPGRPLLRDDKYMTMALRRFISQVDLLIFCLPPWETARQNLSNIGRDQLAGVDMLQLEKIHWAYGYQASMFARILYERVTLWDYTRMSHDHIREAVSELVRSPA